jgi:hypothetical protein
MWEGTWGLKIFPAGFKSAEEISMTAALQKSVFWHTLLAHRSKLDLTAMSANHRIPKS